MTYGLADVVQQRRLIERSEADETYKRLSSAKLDAMLALAEAADCRRARLLGYFGESSPPCAAHQNACDNCVAPPALRDATEDARKLLSTIYRCHQAGGFGFAAGHIIDVVRGKSGDKVARFGHERLSTFGIGADRTEAEWRLLLRQLVAQRIVEVDSDHYNVLRLTEASRAVLRGEQRIELRLLAPEQRRPREKRVSASANLDGAAEALFKDLREWRAEIAREHGVRAYVVFSDATLRAIAQARPAALGALAQISGIGAVKLERYGTAVLELLSRADRSGPMSAPTALE
jgi:ATP-dependent DNA helicase RecQ